MRFSLNSEAIGAAPAAPAAASPTGPADYAIDADADHVSQPNLIDSRWRKIRRKKQQETIARNCARPEEGGRSSNLPTGFKTIRLKLMSLPVLSMLCINLVLINCLVQINKVNAEQTFAGDQLSNQLKKLSDISSKSNQLKSSSEESTTASESPSNKLSNQDQRQTQQQSRVNTDDEVIEGQVIERKTSSEMLLALNLGIEQLKYQEQLDIKTAAELQLNRQPKSVDGDGHRIGKRNYEIRAGNASVEAADGQQPRHSLVFTNQFVVQIDGGEDEARKIADKHGFIYLNHILDNFYHLEHSRLSRRSILVDKLQASRNDEDQSLISDIQDEPKVSFILEILRCRAAIV